MSYDLYFYKSKTSNLTEEYIKNYLTRLDNFIFDETNIQWDYFNKETGVYFGIDWSDPNIDIEETGIWDNFEDFENLNFFFTINFIRPDYFGYESFPILDKIMSDLDLYILNPQDEINPDHPQKFEKGYLINQWINHNEKLIIQNLDEFLVDFYPKEKSDYIWNYQFFRNQLQESLEEDIFVGGYLLFKNNTDGKIYSACIWPNHIPLVLPPVDFMIIKREYKKFFRIIKENGFVSIQQIENKLGKYFEEFDYKISGLKILYQENADKMKQEFNDLKIEFQVNDFGDLISFDRFVNVKY